MGLTAADVRTALLTRWPPSEYVTIEEAPQSADRQGRKLDVVAVSLWRSRGYELDGVEVKVSVGDWRRELREAGKADWWWQHVHRFWVAAPSDVAAKIRSELPTGWGLLSCGENGAPRALVAAERHDAERLPIAAVAGLLRAASGAGFNALQRAEAAGYQRGVASARAEAERINGDEALRRKLADMRARAEAFKAASGLDILGGWGEHEAARIGQMVALVKPHLGDPEGLVRDLVREADRIGAQAEHLRSAAEALRAMMTSPS